MNNQNYVVFGITENTISRIWPYLEYNNITDKVLYFCDNNRAIHNTKVKGFTVYPADKLKENPEAVIIIAAMSVKRIIAGLREKGIKNKAVTYPWFRVTLIDHKFDSEYMRRNQNEILQLYHTGDDYTNRILKQIISQRTDENYRFVETKDIEDFEAVHDYFYDDVIAPKSDITFVDIGAFNGDSILSTYKRYQSRIKKIYAFEPDRNNYLDLEKNIQDNHLQDRSTCCMCGISDKEETAYFIEGINEPTLKRIGKDGSGSEIELRSLDAMNISVTGDLLIKMDVEGSEMSALMGSEKTIQKYTPYLAICIYHKMEDILEIPKYISSINPDYDFYIRGGGHLVCYAVPKRIHSCQLF